LALSLGLCLGAGPVAQRLAGPLAVVILVPAMVLQLGGAATGRQLALRYASLLLGVLAVAEGGWAGLGPDGAALWLHRSVVLLAAVVLMTLVYGVGLARLSRAPAWAACARWLAPLLGVGASMLLLVILAQELLRYDFLIEHTLMARPAVVLVAAALLGLMGAAIHFAVVPGRDPFVL